MFQWKQSFSNDNNMEIKKIVSYTTILKVTFDKQQIFLFNKWK